MVKQRVASGRIRHKSDNILLIITLKGLARIYQNIDNENQIPHGSTETRLIKALTTFQNIYSVTDNMNCTAHNYEV